VKPWIPGVAGALAVFALFPADLPLSQRWARAIAVAPSPTTRADSSQRLDSSLLFGKLDSPRDTGATPADPFGLPPEPTPQGPRVTAEVGPILPPPPRIWKATGRVGIRAALLSSPDGRILVVSDGMKVDSATVVSIGNGGVTLEDRAGRFVLRIP